MKTLADLKRAMVAGSKWHTTWATGGTVRDRTISKVQGNGVWFPSVKDPEKTSWFAFPKASELVFSGGHVHVYTPHNPSNPRRWIMTYTPAEHEPYRPACVSLTRRQGHKVIAKGESPLSLMLWQLLNVGGRADEVVKARHTLIEGCTFKFKMGKDSYTAKPLYGHDYRLCAPTDHH